MSNLSVFSFNSKQVRTVTDSRDGSVWFVASDVASALDYRDAANMVRNLDDDEKGAQIVSTLGGSQSLSVINESGLYAAILKSRKPEAKQFKKWVTSEVLPSIRKTGGYMFARSEKQEILEMGEKLADMLNLQGSGRLAAVGKLVNRHIPELSIMLPDYSVDAPATSNTNSSEPTFSATHLLKKAGSNITAAQFNQLASSYGLLHKKTRKGRAGKLRHFWSISESGLAYGKNITSPACQNETQPHWYENCFSELLVVLTSTKKAA